MSPGAPSQRADETPTGSQDEVDRYYLRLWRRAGFALGPPERRRWRWMERTVRRFDGGTGPHQVLDYGCGSGRFLPLLASLDLGAVHGFDITPSVLEEVGPRHPYATLIAGDGTYPTALGDASYRLVITSEVIEHTLDQGGFLTDVHRILAPGGLLVLTTPNARFETLYKAGTKGLQPVESWLDAAGLETLLADSGFERLTFATLGAHWANMPYRRFLLYRLLKKIGRRLGLWRPVDALESRLAAFLGRGITLLVAARKPIAS